jgi:hypothetical protein
MKFRRRVERMKKPKKEEYGCRKMGKKENERRENLSL